MNDDGSSSDDDYEQGYNKAIEFVCNTLGINLS